MNDSAIEHRERLFGGSPTMIAAARLDAERILVGVRDRDDGQGYSDPVYTDGWKTVALASGAVVALGDTPTASGWVRFDRAPGSPFITSNQDRKFREPSLPFRREWPVALGRRRFLTDLRVLDAASHATLFETASQAEIRNALQRHAILTDLSIDEERAIVLSKEGRLELWEVEPRELTASFGLEGADTFECALFVGPDSLEIVAGTRGGDILWFALDSRAEERG